MASLSDTRVDRFFDNNILFGSAWCLVMAQIQFSLIKKIKIGSLEHSLNFYSYGEARNKIWTAVKTHSKGSIGYSVLGGNDVIAS